MGIHADTNDIRTSSPQNVTDEVGKQFNKESSKTTLTISFLITGVDSQELRKKEKETNILLKLPFLNSAAIV